MSIAQNYIQVKDEVCSACKASGRNPEDVTLLAVSKTVGLDGVVQAFEAGARDFGENRPDDLVEKSRAFPDARWHFIGNIQSRRIKDIVPHVYMIHSLHERHHADKIDACARDCDKRQRVLIEVNVSGEASKSGISPAEVDGFIKHCVLLQNIDICGLMTMAPLGNLSAARDCFAGLSVSFLAARNLLENIAPERAHLFTELSMGMTDDWPIAIEEGSTIVRIGRAIFA